MIEDIKKYINLRLALASAVLLVVFIFYAVPIAIEIRGLCSEKPIISPLEITGIARWLYAVVLPALISMFTFSVWFYLNSSKTFIVLFFEKYMFHLCVYCLAAGSVAIYRTLFTDNKFNIGWEFIGFSVVCVVLIGQWSYKSLSRSIRS